MRRVKPMTTNPRVRQATPPSTNDSGVEPPATPATPPVLSAMAMPGASTDTLMAMASDVRSEPRASCPELEVTSTMGADSDMSPSRPRLNATYGR